MTSTFTGIATSLRTHFCISNAGGASLRATRYAKNAASFLAAVRIRCLALWLAIS